MAALWASPAYRNMRSDVAKKQWRDPEFRNAKTKHNSEIAVANNARPEKKRQQSELIKKLNADPAFRERRVAALRAAFARRRAERTNSAAMG